MERKEMKKDFSRVGGRMLIGLIITMALQIVGQGLVAYLRPEWQDNYTIMMMSSMIPMYVVGYPITFLLMRKGESRTIEKHNMKAGQFAISAIICYGIMIAGNLIGLVVTSVIGAVKGGVVNNAVGELASSGNIWFTAVFTVIAAPIVEELLFRKVICQKVIKYGQGVAIVISGLMFGLYHMNFNQFFYAFFLGMFLAYIYVKTGNIKYTIGIHMIVNFIGGVVGSLLVQNVDTESMTGILIYGIYAICVYAVAITGIVLFFVFKSKMSTERGEVVIEKKERFQVMILNAGMLLYSIVCLAIMIYQAAV